MSAKCPRCGKHHVLPCDPAEQRDPLWVDNAVALYMASTRRGGREPRRPPMAPDTADSAAPLVRVWKHPLRWLHLSFWRWTSIGAEAVGEYVDKLRAHADKRSDWLGPV